MDTLPKEASDFLKKIAFFPLTGVTPLAGDASQRKYYRLFVQGGKAYILMLWGSSRREQSLRFLSVQKHFSKHKIRVPQIISYDSDLKIFLLEDLGDMTLEAQFLSSQCQDSILPFYKEAVDELIKIYFYSTKDDPLSCSAFQIEFNTEKLLWEMNYGRKHFLEGLMNIEFSSKESSQMDSVFTQICTQLHQHPKYICHRDYHSRNLLIYNKKIQVIDFQDARLGPVQYDLVSLLYDSYVNLSSELIEEVLDYYHEQSQNLYQQRPSLDEFNYIFKLQIIQRCFKACGSFASFYNMRGDSRYLKYIPKAIGRVNDTLMDFQEYSAFQNILRENQILEKSRNYL